MSTLLQSSSPAYLGQLQVSAQRRMPTDDGSTSNVQSVTGETVQFFYYDSTTGVLTQDAGQAAGTVVVANLTNKNVLNALGDVIGSYGDSSFSFTTGTILTTLKPFRGILAEQAEQNGLSQTKGGQGRANAVTDGFGRGDYCIDHDRGVIYGKKATAGTSDTGAYKVLTPGGGAAVPENVNIAKIGGAATAASAALADATANPTVGSFGAYDHVFNGTTWDRKKSGQTANSTTITGMDNGLPMARYNATPTARTEAQFGNLQEDVSGSLNINSATLISGEDQTNGLLGVQIKPLASATYAATASNNLGAATTLNVKSTSGNIFSCYCTNTNAAVRYFQVHNKASAPTAGNTPIFSFLVPATNGMTIVGTDFFGTAGINLGSGVSWAISTTASTYTAATAADHMSSVTYI